MNRIVLMGNGFDLAKGLKSRYSDFIDWFWKKMIEDFNSQQTRPFENEFIHIDARFNYKGRTDIFNYQSFLEALKRSDSDIRFKNDFLRIISNKCTSNWVDIEDEYFQEIKSIIKDHSLRNQEYNDIRKLNNDFDKIKCELEKYLTSELDNFDLQSFDFKNISESFNLFDFTSKGVEKFQDDYFSKIDDETKKTEFEKKKEYLNRDNYLYCNTNIYPENTLFLSFNYTNFGVKLIECIQNNTWRLDDWAKSMKQAIYIHGELNNPKNQIIFGYGDENDEIHSAIEKNGGDYLTNIKTINYLKTNNYKNLLNFLESGLYQVFIIGHSCGLSDKTLLKTMFEHENCISIKPFYYVNSEGHNNYDDIVKNIYRTFSDKALMRDKVVNQRFCSKICV